MTAWTAAPRFVRLGAERLLVESAADRAAAAARLRAAGLVSAPVLAGDGRRTWPAGLVLWAASGLLGAPPRTWDPGRPGRRDPL